MMQLNCGRVSATAQSVGLGDRFRYWRGASGRRYLFSLVQDSDLHDLQNAIVIEALFVGSEPVPVWLGEIDSDGTSSGRPLGAATALRRRTFVHFLSSSDEERRAILHDLAGGPV
jgi:hypothetical protein